MTPLGIVTSIIVGASPLLASPALLPALVSSVGSCPNPLPVWTVTLPRTTGTAVARDMAVDAEENILITGYFWGTQDFDPDEDVDLHTSTVQPDFFYSEDIFVSKYSSDGAYLWTRTVGGSGDDRGDAIVVDKNAKALVVGSFCDTVHFDRSDGIDERTAIGESNAFVLILSQAGDYVAAVTFGETTERSLATGVGLDTDGSIVVVGSFTGRTDFDPSSGEDIRVGRADIFITRLAAEGSYLWTRTFGGPIFDDVEGVAVDLDGNIFVGGEFRGTVDFDPDGAGDVYTTEGTAGTYLSKRRPDGAYEWTRVWQFNIAGVNVSLATDADGSVYTAGAFSGAADLDPTDDGLDIRFAGVNTYDAFVTRLVGDGSYGWTTSFLHPGSGSAKSVAVAQNGSVVVTGSFVGTADFDPSDEQDLRRSAGLADFFVTMLGPHGSYRWTRTFGGADNDGGRRVVLDADGSAIVLGYFKDTTDFDPGCGLDVRTPVLIGNSEPFLTKLSCLEGTADADSDGIVDLRDFAAFQRCFTGPAPTVCQDGCQRLDLDPDDDIDLADYAEFQSLIGDPGP